MGTVRDTSVGTIWVAMCLSPVLLVSTGVLLAHDGRVGFSREAREAGAHSPLCVVSISLVGVNGRLLAHDGRVGFSREAREAGTPLCVVSISLVGVDGLLRVHDGRVGFSREAREAGTHTPLCVVAISGAMLRGTFHWPVLGRPSKHVPTLVLSFALTITTNS